MTTLLILAVLIAAGCGWVQAKIYLTQSQALQEAFPSYQVERKTLFMTQDQARQIEQKAGTKLNSLITTYYVARQGPDVTGIAFFDRRTVRTLPVTYMVVVKPSGEVSYVDLLSFEEPEDYTPPPAWLTLYRNRALSPDLEIGKGIPHITGASLTSQALNEGIRTILAIYQVGVKGTL